MHRRLLAGIEGEIRFLEVARDEPGALERAADARGDPLHQMLERIRARGWDRDEPQGTLALPAIDTVEHQQVKVHIEVERTAEALDQGHRPATALARVRPAWRIRWPEIAR